jgi:hypothetical protein
MSHIMSWPPGHAARQWSLWAVRACYLAGLAVAGSPLAVMLVSRYVDLGRIGPFPDLYDPVWFPEKLLAAFAEGAAFVTALAGVVITGLAARRPPAKTGPQQQ